MTARLGWAVAIVAVLALFVYAASSEFLSGPRCSQEPLRSARAPNGMAATVMRENCGAADAYAYFVALGGDGEAPRSTDDYIFSKSGDDDIAVAWNGDDELSVVYSNTGRVFRKAVIWGGMKITYTVQ